MVIIKRNLIIIYFKQAVGNETSHNQRGSSVTLSVLMQYIFGIVIILFINFIIFFFFFFLKLKLFSYFSIFFLIIIEIASVIYYYEDSAI
jgi:hypothetical protein